jgi:protein SCO1/2
VKLARSVLGVLLIVAAGACGPAEPEFYGSTFGDVGSPKDFTLTDQYGQPYRLADHRGKVVLLFFGYAHCPDVCPVTLSNWARVEEALAGNDEVEFVFITVDPERDTIERLRDHLEIFSDKFRGLSGTEEQVTPVYERFGIFRKKIPFSSSAIGYVVDHSTVMLVLDREGKARLTFPFDADPDEIVHDVRRLLES